MGRGKEQGTKNLAKLVENPRFVRVFVTKGNYRMPMNISASSFDLIEAGFERRGYKLEKSQ